MKTATAFLLVSCLVAVAYAGRIYRDTKYTTKYDNVNVDEILRSDRLVKNYFDCLMDKGPCTPEGSELKKSIPDALQTECSKCTEKQKEKAHKVIRHLIENKPDMWSQLEAKWDPTGEYRKKYDAEYKKIKN
ncbi:ejaculatory bulb-specific protein 3-like [Ischnura elegans]|uniref:ejaculatory bulb-specific protein 3-like n=1 Tax=Ischnura elegans TaxID=197161 RepID=UPI001ED8B0C2|nr:ejaculatory bulb-specific protein 3-like [Ischnura elegans]